MKPPKSLRLLGWMAGVSLAAAGCASRSDQQGGDQLAELEALNQTARITVAGHPFDVWLALTEAQQQQGLMFVTEDQMQPTAEGVDRGMLFVFDRERPLTFWMRNTVIPLDIAYIRSDGRIVKIYTMPPLATRVFPSVEPAQFALEASAGAFQRLGISQAHTVEIPDSVLKAAP